jgi:phage protein D
MGVDCVSSPYPSSSAPRFLVTIGGTEFHEYSGTVTNVVVDTTIEGANRFVLTLVNPFDHEQGSFQDLKWKSLEPGTAVQISLGYGESTPSTKVFKGEIATVEPDFQPGQPPKVKVTGYSPLWKMMQGTNSKSWEEKELGKIVSAVASEHLDSVTTEKATVKPKRVFQDDQSDYRFIKELAEKYGFEFFVSLGKGTFRPKTGGSSPDDPVAELYYGESLEAFSGELRPPEHGTVEVRHWDETKEKKITATASNEKGSGKRVYRIPVDSQSEAKKIAQSKLDELLVEGYGETFGIPSVVAGTVVKLDGLGSKFTNNYYVTRATHRVGDSGYRMSFEGKRLTA